MTEIVPGSSEGKVILDSSTPAPKKQISPSVKWFFTFNNYTEEDILIIVPKFQEICTKYCFQKEIGKCGTAHLQGNIWLKTKMRPDQFELSKKIH